MNDLISRQAAIDAFWKLDVEIRPSAIDAITKMLEDLPAAQPEIIRCKDCTYWHDSGKCECFSIPERNIEVHMDKDGFCSEAERKTDERPD